MATTLDWYGCSTFMMRTSGLRIMLDAYVERAANAAGPGVGIDHVTECDWICVGHAHFDHLYGAERIAATTGATVIAGYESVRLLEQAGVPLEQMICVAGGEKIDLGNDVVVDVYPSQHSCVWSHTEMDVADHVCIGDLGVTWHEQRERMAELTAYLSTELDPVAVEHLLSTMAGHSDRGDGGALLFHFTTPDGTVLFQDTSGHWSGVMDLVAPDAAILAAAGRGNVDGEPIQGSLAEFVARQVELLERPATIVLGHHDNWLPGFSIDTDVEPIRRAVEAVAPASRLLELGYLDGTTILP